MPRSGKGGVVHLDLSLTADYSGAPGAIAGDYPTRSAMDQSSNTGTASVSPAFREPPPGPLRVSCATPYEP